MPKQSRRKNRQTRKKGQKKTPPPPEEMTPALCAFYKEYLDANADNIFKQAAMRTATRTRKDEVKNMIASSINITFPKNN